MNRIQMPPAPPTYLTESEIEAMLGQINAHTTTGLRDRAIIAVILGAGLTVGELVALTGRDVEPDATAVRVHHRAAHRDRRAPLEADERQWLAAWARRREALGLSPDGPLFCGIRTLGAALDTRAVRYTISRLAAKAGVGRPVGPHTLRQTYAVRLLRRGADIRRVQELLGHSDISTTMLYVRAAAAQPPPPAAPPALLPPSRQELGERLGALKREIAELERLLGK